MYEVDFLGPNWLLMRMGNEGFSKRAARLRGTVYDLGCGARPFAAELAAAGTRYVGIDWPSSLHGAHADIVADLNRPLPVGDAVADAVMALSVLEHLHEPATMLREAFRILKPGGFLYVAVPFQWAIHEAPHDYFRFTRHGLEHLLRAAGFTGIDIRENGGFWTMSILKLNYQSVRLIRGPMLLKRLVNAALLPFWLLGQLLAPLVDRAWPAPGETQGYHVSAIKP